MEEVDISTKAGKKLYEKFTKICEKIQKNQTKNEKLIIELDSFKESLLKFLQPKQKKAINLETSGLLKKKELTVEAKKIIGEILKTDDEINELARQEITKILCNYINEEKLKCEDNKKYFLVNDKLSDLFNIEEGTKLTYPSLQKYLNYIYKKDCEYYPTDELVNFCKKIKQKINKKNSIELVEVYNIFNNYKLEHSLGDSKKIQLDEKLMSLFQTQKNEISITKMKNVIKNTLLEKKCLI